MYFYVNFMLNKQAYNML